MKYDNGMALVYLGPSFYGIIQKGTALTGGYPEKFQALLDTYPFMKGLLISTEKLAEKRKELKERDSEMALLYRRAEQVKEDKYV